MSNIMSTHPATGRHRLFVYGTLMFPEIFRRVALVEPRYTNAILRDYHRCRIKDANGKILSYPAVYPNKNSVVTGLITEVNLEALERIDKYEGDEYKRVECLVETDMGTCQAFVYVWNRDPSMLFSHGIQKIFP